MNRLILSQGSTFSVGAGSSLTNVFGTAAGAETISIALGAKVVLDASFNRGGDVIRLSGNAASYTAVQSGSSIILTDTEGTSVTIPVGTTGAQVSFADSAPRTLFFDTNLRAIKLGTDTIDATADALSAGTALPPAPTQTVTLTKSVTSVEEGGSALFTLQTTGVPAGTEYTYTLTGIAAHDVVGGALTGTAKIGADGKAVIQVNLAEDARTEGLETFSLSVAGENSGSVTIVDTSTAPIVAAPIYVFGATATSVNEGGTAFFRLNTTNVASGSQFNYIITGVDAADVAGGLLTGVATVGADGVALVSVNLVADGATEGAETLSVSVAGQTASTTVNDTSSTPAEQTSFTVASADIAIANALNVPVSVEVGNTGTRTVTIQSDGATATRGVIINGNADTTVTSGALGDLITLSGNGNNTVDSGAGNDTVTVFGSGNNTVNVGTGEDNVTTGAGNDTIVFASGALGEGDFVTASGGNDTVVISGDGNVVAANAAGTGAVLTGVENIVLNGTTVSIANDALAALVTGGLVSISGNPTTSVITVTATTGATIDLTGIALNDLNNLRVDAGAGGTATLRLSAAQIAELATITEAGTTNLTVNTTVAGFQALGTKATGSTVTITDTVENLVAAGNTITGATATLGNATVAQAAAALASGLTVSYTLVDSAANLALAPTAVFRSASAVTVSGEANAAQASAIQTSIAAANTGDASPIAAATLTLNVRDTASNVSNYLLDTIDADTVAAVGNQALTLDQAASMVLLNANATYQIVDTPTNLVGAIAGPTSVLKLAALNRASQITANGALSVANVVAINGYTAGAAADLAPGYVLVDSLTNLTAGGAATAVINNAANITANDVSVSVSQALSLEALGNTGTTSYVLDDTLVNLLAASSQVTTSATAVSVTGAAALTVANINSLVNKFGTAKVNEAGLTISDTVANLLNLSAGSVTEATTITISSGTATAQEALSLKALTGAKMPAAFTVLDTAANLSAAFATTANVGVLELATAINVSGTASVAEIIALNTSLAANAAGLSAVTAGGYGLQDTAANLSNPAAASAAVAGAAATVVITGDVTLTQLAAIDALPGSAAPTGFNLVGTAADLFALGAAAGTPIDRAANVTVTGQASLAQIQGIAAAYTAAGDDAVLGTSLVYSITDLPSAFDTAVAANLTILNAATTATMIGTKVQIFGGTLTTARRDVADTIIANDALGNLATLTTAQLAEIDRIVITDTDLFADDAVAAIVNALSAAKPTAYSIIDAYADLTPATPSAALVTYLANATTVVVDATPGGLLDSLTVTQFNTLDALTGGTIQSRLTGTVAQLTAANAATAVASAVGFGVTVTDTGASVAQAATLVARDLPVGTIVVTDTAAAIQAAASTLVTAVNSFVVSDNGFITGSVALVSKVYAANTNAGSSYGNYAIVDTAANVVAGGVHAVNFAQSVTVTGTADRVQANTLGGLTAMGPITYSISDTAANVDTTNTAALNGALNITATGNATLTQAITINGATNSGTTSYAISGNAATLALATTGNEVAIAAINAATGTVTVTDAATGAQASLLAAYTKPVVFDVSDGFAAVAASTGLGEARNITATGTATTTAAATIMGAGNTGTTTIDRVDGTAAEVLALTLGANDTITDLRVTGTTTIADAVAINAKDTGTNIVAVSFATVSGSAADVLANLAVAGLATTVTVTGTVTAAQAALLSAADIADGTTAYTYSVADSFSNIMVETDAVAGVDNATAYAARSVTATDTALTVAQAVSLRTTGAASYVYSIQDNDANIVAAVNTAGAARNALASAASVRGADGVALTVATVGSAFGVVGTKAQLDSLPTVLQGAAKVYEVSVADLAANPDFYVAAGIQFRVTDTAANLVSGNALVPRAAALVATDAANVAQATTLTTLGPASVRYSLSDAAAALVAGAVLNGAVNVVATGTATEAQAEVIIDATNSGTVTYDISQADTGVSAAATGASNEFAAGVNAYDGARNITITGTAGVNANQANELLSSTNSGTTVIAKVNGTSAALAALVVGSNDTITAVTPSDAATVAQIVAMRARAGSITSYNLSDTAVNLAAADPSILNGATNIALSSGTATVEQAAIIDAATNLGTTTFEIADTAANILAAGASNPALLAADLTDPVQITDTTVTAAVATQLRALDAANNGATGFTIAQVAGVADVFAISDTVANLTATANVAAVTASTDVRITGDVTVAEATLVRAVATGDVTGGAAYNLVDTYSRLVASLAVTTAATNVRITGVVTVSQANQAATTFGASAAELSMDIRDNASALFAGIAGQGVTAAETIALSTAATVAQAGVLSENAKLVGGYSISDTAANVAGAINTANAAGAADRSTVLGAASVTLTNAATVAEALGNRATEARGIYTLTGVSYAITDSAANIITALSSNDAPGLNGASAVRINDASVTVTQAQTLIDQLENFVGDDGLGGYDLADTFNLIQGANEALLVNASTVRANGTAGAETMDMSGIGRAVYVNGNGDVDTMFGTDFADTMDGGTGADVMTGGNGRDAFVLDANNVDDGATLIDDRFSDSSTGARDQIIDFTLATAAWTGSAANDTVAEFQALAIGGAGADILDINLTGVAVAIEANAASTVSTTAATLAASVKTSLAAAATGDITVAVTNGIMSISSTVGADFDTLGEVVAAAQLVAATDGETLGFEFGGSTYVFTQNGTQDILVQLTAVTGVAGLDLLDTTGTVGGANWIIIG